MTKVTKKLFGKTGSGEEVEAYTISSDLIRVTILNYGGIIQSLEVPDKNGEWDDITTGFDTFEEYPQKSKFFGCLVGRYANRIGGAKFNLNGKEYSLFKNNGGTAPNFKNSLHGGQKGFDKYIWETEQTENGICMKLTSNDGDEGYPAKLEVEVNYTVVDNDFTISYVAKNKESELDTVVNLTNHAYFNLDGHKNWGRLDNHHVTLNANHYTPVDSGAIPTGEIKDVINTPFDLRQGKTMTKAVLDGVDGNNGYDHNWCLKMKNSDQKNHAASVTSSLTGRKMDVYTTNPGIQFYTGNFLPGDSGKKGAKYVKQSAYCLETQHFPDSPNQPDFPTTTIKPGCSYVNKTSFVFNQK